MIFYNFVWCLCQINVGLDGFDVSWWCEQSESHDFMSASSYCTVRKLMSEASRPRATTETWCMFSNLLLFQRMLAIGSCKLKENGAILRNWPSKWISDAGTSFNSDMNNGETLRDWDLRFESSEPFLVSKKDFFIQSRKLVGETLQQPPNSHLRSFPFNQNIMKPSSCNNRAFWAAGLSTSSHKILHFGDFP